MNLLFINDKLQTARYSVDIFGLLKSNNQENKLKELKSLFHLMAKETHADLFTKDEDKKIAHEAFIKLTEWHELAIKDVENDKYGKRDTIKVKTGKNSYIIHGLHKGGDIADILNCTKEGDTKKDLVLKIVREQNNNDLINNEIKVLKKLYSHTEHCFKLISNHTCNVIEVFEADKKQAIIFEKLNGFYNLAEIYEAYPNGVDPKNMAWIFRRMLGIQGALHELGLVHGNIIPTNFMICPETHNGKLIDFTNTVEIGQKAKTINPDYKDFYPSEVFNKKELTPATDIYMTAMCMVKLLGGNVKTKEVPTIVPNKIVNYLKSCLIENPNRRWNNALDIHNDFGYTLDEIWKRQFHNFKMKS